MISEKRLDSHCETSSTIHYFGPFATWQRKSSLKNFTAHFESLGPFSVYLCHLSVPALLLSSLCASAATAFGRCSATKTNKTKKHIISFDEQSSLCQFIHLLQHRADMIQHNVVCLPLCNSLGYLCSFNFGSCHSEYQSPP